MADDATTKPALSDILISNRQLFTNVTSLAVEVSIDQKLAPNFPLKAGEKPTSVSKFGYSFSGENFKYSLDFGNFLQTKDEFSEMAFNGQTFGYLEKKFNVLYISKKNLLTTLPIGTCYDALLRPFAFLNNPSGKYVGLPLLSYHKLSNIELWKPDGLNPHFIGIEYHGTHKCVVFEFDNQLENSWDFVKGLGCKMQVYFAEDEAFYPIYWKRTSDGHLVDTYEVKDLRTVKYDKCALLVPFKAEELFYDSKGNAGETTTLTVSSLEFNRPMSDDCFSIDPSMANTIIDSATKAVISVPK